MLQSALLIPTLRDAPSDAEVISHKLMIRAGYIRKLASGVYSYLPLAYRVFKNIEKIIAEEMTAAGAQQVLLPVVMPAELWMETGRWQHYGKELLRFKDRHDRDFCIGPTHEEAMTDLVRGTVSSYRQLPINLFQIQTKFRDEVRPRYGLMRGREFIMKDGYSFHTSEADCHREYDNMAAAYRRVFTRCGLDFRAVEAVTGNIGGSKSHEFQVLAASGEDIILSCTACEYAANVERAALAEQKMSDELPKLGKYQKVSTPGVHSVVDVAKFLQVDPSQLIKTLIYAADGKLIAVLVRGDHELMEPKLKLTLGCNELILASPDQIKVATAGPLGFSGPVGLTVPIYADYAVALMNDSVTGANAADTHLTGVNLGDYKVTGFGDFRRANAGDSCVRCFSGTYEEHRGIEVGQVFFLGTKYSKSMNAVFKDEQGNDQIMIMGTYGIGVSRTAAAAVEQNNDANGISWPYAIAPFQFHLISLDVQNAEVKAASQKIYDEIKALGLEVLWDDREANPGFKFKDSDLIGIPYRIVVGCKGLNDQIVELKTRKDGSMEKIPLTAIIAKVESLHQSHSS